MKYTIKADERNIEGKKYCYTCQAWKSVNCFSKDCSKIDGLSSQCKDCKKVKDKIYRDKPENKAKAKEYFRDYYKKNEDRLKDYEKQRSKTKHRIEYRKRYNDYWNSKPENQALKKSFDVCYYTNNRETICNKRKIKYSTDVDYRLNRVMSSSLYTSLKQNKTEQHWENMVSYSFQKLKEHIESQFTPEMSWDNYGEYWEIDHIIPKNLFNFSDFTDKQFQICWSLANLRPLEKSLNRSRPKDGSDISEELKQQILGQDL